MKPYDWIVVGGGITGAALSYELVKNGFSVLLVEQQVPLKGATRYSYGGLAYWSGTTALTRQLCAEGINRHRTLADELEAETQFRELDLLLTISYDQDPVAVAATYAQFAIPPKLLSIEAACTLEPLLNPAAIAGALTVKHGHIHPEITAQSYRQAFLRAGGQVQLTEVLGLLTEGDRIMGIKTRTETFSSPQTVICAGGFSRALLKSAGIPVPLYFTHAELIETSPVDLQLRTLIMPAQLQRQQLEVEASTISVDSLWDQPGHEPASPILDVGAIQFQDGSLRIGQMSRVLTDPCAEINSAQSEAALRAGVRDVLPTLADLSGIWHHCIVAFSRDRLPLIGPLPGVAGVHLFAGFSNPLAIVPALAQRFAYHATGQADSIVAQLSPARFILS